MKTTAYIFAALNALIWALLIIFAAHYLARWWKWTGDEPYGGSNLLDALMILLPPTGFATVILSVFFLRKRIQWLFTVSCFLMVTTFGAGLLYLAQYTASV